jgi:hypothetical protein
VHRQGGGVWRGRSTRALPDDRRAFGQHYEPTDKGTAICENAKRWEGWGTALKPAHEPIALARKPFRGTVASNVLAHGTGALNIEGARVGSDLRSNAPAGASTNSSVAMRGGFHSDATATERIGRWPANVLTDGSVEVLEAFPQSARDAIRFFYAPKADKADREFGMLGARLFSAGAVTCQKDGALGLNSPRAGAGRTSGARNFHPTVKPVDLMRWLCRLITPPAGVVLEPFMGSGSTGIAAIREGFRFVGIEQSPDYFEIARRRIQAAVDEAANTPDLVRQVDRAVAKLKAAQMSLSL